ncbi:transporter [Flavobacterium luteum]|uniref:Transporter n=1 Tax=Flavobacterium luteum TaxID=2026654 RepID=A0A7J5ABQ7_9FLAO|nr:transporter [Flavobacterium luteum]KAB1154858.1 transporter [Flavobacterium luteum]
MFKIKSLLLVSLLLYTTAHYGQFTDVINSNRPGESMAAFSVGKTVFQAELGLYGFKEKHELLNYEANGFGSNLDFRYGAFLEQLEFIVNFQYQYENFTAPMVNINQNGLKKTIIGAKFLVYDPYKKYIEKPNLYSWKANHKFSYRQFIPAVGIYAGLNINLSDNVFIRPQIPNDPNISPKFMVLTQNQFGKFVLCTNIILDKFSSEKQSIDYVVTLTRGFNSRWSGFLENQGFNSDYYSDAIFRTGAAFLVKQNIQIDASIGVNYKDTPSVLAGGVGLSWRFDKNYSEVLYRIPKEKDKKKSKADKKKDKKKEKDKKRLDEIESTTLQP